MAVINLKNIPRHLKAANELELEKKILKLQLRVGASFKIVNIYPITGGVVAWLYYDSDIKEVLSNGSLNETNT
jgi:hypothetical protein